MSIYIHNDTILNLRFFELDFWDNFQMAMIFSILFAASLLFIHSLLLRTYLLFGHRISSTPYIYCFLVQEFETWVCAREIFPLSPPPNPPFFFGPSCKVPVSLVTIRTINSRCVHVAGEDPMLSDQQQYRYMTVDDMKSMGDDSMRVNVTDDERDNRHSGGKSMEDCVSKFSLSLSLGRISDRSWARFAFDRRRSIFSFLFYPL